MRVGSVQIRADTNFARGAAGVPLTVAEERAYATIGSSRYLEKEMRPQACGHASFLTEEEMDAQREERLQHGCGTGRLFSGDRFLHQVDPWQAESGSAG
jgi:hypothetical protein